MFCMKIFSEHETAFLNAVSLLVERDWKGRKGLFAGIAGISGGYLSEIIGKKKCPKIDKQENIAKKLGYSSLLEFIEYGKSVKQEDMMDVIPKARVQTTTPTPTMTAQATTTPPKKQCQTYGNDIQNKKLQGHQELVGGFNDTETAIEINKMLIDIEKMGGPVALGRAMGKIEELKSELVKKYGGSQSTGTRGE